MKVFVLHDSKAEAYLKPMFFENAGTASRSFGDTISKGEGEFADHAEDFTLFEIGSYDRHMGRILMHDAKISLGNGLEFKKKQ